MRLPQRTRWTATPRLRTRCPRGSTASFGSARSTAGPCRRSHCSATTTLAAITTSAATVPHKGTAEGREDDAAARSAAGAARVGSSFFGEADFAGVGGDHGSDSDAGATPCGGGANVGGCAASGATSSTTARQHHNPRRMGRQVFTRSTAAGCASGTPPLSQWSAWRSHPGFPPGEYIARRKLIKTEPAESTGRACEKRTTAIH